MPFFVFLLLCSDLTYFSQKSLAASSSGRVHLNLTGVMLRDLAEMKFDILKDNDSNDLYDNISRSALSTVGLRRATEARMLKMTNTTGLDINVQLNLAPTDPTLMLVKNNTEVVLGHIGERDSHDQHTVSVEIASTSATTVGERQPLVDLPITSSSLSSACLYILHPTSSNELGKKKENDVAHYDIAPVVESCIRNERLQPSISDMFGLSKGRDLLSSEVWRLDEETAANGLFIGDAGGSGRYIEKTGLKLRGNWLKPYVKSDPPAWSDMTGTQEVSRDVSKQFLCRFNVILFLIRLSLV